MEFKILAVSLCALVLGVMVEQFKPAEVNMHARAGVAVASVIATGPDGLRNHKSR